MSFIFDALRKSEAARGSVPATAQSAQFAAEAPRRWPWLVLGTIALAAALVGLGWVLNDRPPTPPQAAPMAPASAVPASTGTADPVRPLAEEAAADASSLARGIPSPPPARTTPTATAQTAPANSGATGDAPPLAALPAGFQATLPSLDMEVHAYAAEPGQRFVIINLHRYHEGDRLAEGPVLMAIRPQGAVLQYRGRQFLLQR